jgi:hypothetical protein
MRMALSLFGVVCTKELNEVDALTDKYSRDISPQKAVPPEYMEAITYNLTVLQV